MRLRRSSLAYQVGPVDFFTSVDSLLMTTNGLEAPCYLLRCLVNFDVAAAPSMSHKRRIQRLSLSKCIYTALRRSLEPGTSHRKAAGAPLMVFIGLKTNCMLDDASNTCGRHVLVSKEAGGRYS